MLPTVTSDPATLPVCKQQIASGSKLLLVILQTLMLMTIKRGTHTVGGKKVPRSIRTTGARFKKKTGGERGMNGNGTGDEQTTVLYVRIPFHFNFPVPVLSAQARLHAYYTIYMYYTYICTIQFYIRGRIIIIRHFYYRVRTCGFHS